MSLTPSGMAIIVLNECFNVIVKGLILKHILKNEKPNRLKKKED